MKLQFLKLTNNAADNQHICQVYRISIILATEMQLRPDDIVRFLFNMFSCKRSKKFLFHWIEMMNLFKMKKYLFSC